MNSFLMLEQVFHTVMVVISEASVIIIIIIIIIILYNPLFPFFFSFSRAHQHNCPGMHRSLRLIV
jgi:hypothetical protein